MPPRRMGKKAAPGREPTGGCKQETLLMLLRRPNGAIIAELVKVTGWQNHSVRGALCRPSSMTSGGLRLGLIIVR